MAHARLPFRIGRYRVQRLLGIGGLATVYLCEDESRGRTVAIKWASGHRNEAAHLHSYREARALAQLEHPNIVRMFDSGEYDGRPFLVLEYVEGSTLREWLAASRPWQETLEIFIRAGRALSYVHAAGFVHRDFKPDNVLIGDDGVVKLADFGLSMRIADDPAEVTMWSPSEGASLPGTREYMPLEQLLGTMLDARSDQFAFCVSLYEASWGELPFDQLGVGAPREPPNRRAIYRIVRRGLEHDVDARWPSMDVLLHQLAATRRCFVARVLRVRLGLRDEDE